MPTFRVTTLGCRVNHAESRELETVLRSRGLTAAGPTEPADLEVVHTCTVTRTAAAKSRQSIRRAARRAGRPAEVIVTGCYAGSHPHEASGLVGDRDHVVPQGADDGSTMIERFTDRLDRWLIRRLAPDSIRTPDGGCSMRPPDRDTTVDRTAQVLPLPVVAPAQGLTPARHTRAELRIQDGCDAHCTFCIIPRIRPVLRSKRIDDAVGEARRLVELGHREIVLTGIFIGAYGHETALRRKQREPGAHPLAELVDAVAQVPGLERLRISSVEPGDVTEALLDAMLEHGPVVVPHLHVPLQSGSDRILRRMNRQYGIDDYLAMIAQVSAALTTSDGLPPALTTDVICGFPGETGDDFAETVRVAERVGYLHMHVFPYSPRDGTAAARWRDDFVAPEEIRRRVRALIDLEEDPGDGLSIRYRRRLLGRTVRVILEQSDPDRPGAMLGRCDHYAQVSVETDRARGTVMEAEVTGVTADSTLADPSGTRLPLMLLKAGS